MLKRAPYFMASYPQCHSVRGQVGSYENVTALKSVEQVPKTQNQLEVLSLSACLPSTRGSTSLTIVLHVHL